MLRERINPACQRLLLGIAVGAFLFPTAAARGEPGMTGILLGAGNRTAPSPTPWEVVPAGAFPAGELVEPELPVEPELIELPSPTAEAFPPHGAPPTHDHLGRPILSHRGRLYRWGPFSHRRPADPDRHVGWGEPLVETSWLNRPWHFDWFLGGLFGGELIDGHDQSEGWFGGYRLGYDFDHYFGGELRFGWSVMEIIDDSPAFSESQSWFLDLHLLYYPWGDSRWRPYGSVGLGVADFDFVDHRGRPIDELLVHVPLGVGVKWLAVNWAALRFDLHNNIAIGNGTVHWMDNVSLTAGMELRFGGYRKSYAPWTPAPVFW